MQPLGVVVALVGVIFVLSAFNGTARLAVESIWNSNA